jgi:hypothetical protein
VSYELIEILASNQATVAQVSANEMAWDEPEVLVLPPQALGFTKPKADVVTGKHVWLVHPWLLADLPTDLPADVVCVALVFEEFSRAHPWNALRWNFVGQRMSSLTEHCWFGSHAEVLQALMQAQSVQTEAHLCLPDLSSAGVQLRAAPRLFRHIDKPMDSFSKWWIQANNNVRHLQQLVYPLPNRAPTL